MSPAHVGTGVPDPDVTTMAAGLYTHLQWEQFFGPIPADAVLRVFNHEDTALVVTVGGLGDGFLFGPDAPVPDRAPHEVTFLLTLKAMRLLRSIERTVAATIEALYPGTPAVPVRVEYENDAQTADLQSFPHGVIVIRRGEIVR